MTKNLKKIEKNLEFFLNAKKCKKHRVWTPLGVLVYGHILYGAQYFYCDLLYNHNAHN